MWVPPSGTLSSDADFIGAGEAGAKLEFGRAGSWVTSEAHIWGCCLELKEAFLGLILLLFSCSFQPLASQDMERSTRVIS